MADAVAVDVEFFASVPTFRHTLLAPTAEFSIPTFGSKQRCAVQNSLSRWPRKLSGA